MKYAFWLFLIGISNQVICAQKRAYQIFDSKGKKVNYNKMLKGAQKSDAVFFGEYHNNSIAHWLQLELLIDLKNAWGAHDMIMGMEMFEHHQQSALNAYLSGQSDDKAFKNSDEYWHNYKTDYKPLVDFCKIHNIKVVGTNIKREYARKVSKAGISGLDTIADLPIPLPFEVDYNLRTYQMMREMFGSHGGNMNIDDFIAAQALKDATMAYRSHQFSNGKKIYHINGSFHTDYKEGIIYYLIKLNPKLRVMNISTVEQDQINQLEKEHLGKADFIIAVPNNMTKTY